MVRKIVNSKFLVLFTLVTLVAMTAVSTAYANTVHDEVQRYGYPLGWGSDQIQHSHPHDRTIWLEQESDTYSGISSAEYEAMQTVFVSNPTAEGIYNVQTMEEDFFVFYRVTGLTISCYPDGYRNGISLHHDTPHDGYDDEYMIWHTNEVHTGSIKYGFSNHIPFYLYNMTTDGDTFESHGYIHSGDNICVEIDHVFPIVITGNCDGTDFLLRGQYNVTAETFTALCELR